MGTQTDGPSRGFTPFLLSPQQGHGNNHVYLDPRSLQALYRSSFPQHVRPVLSAARDLDLHAWSLLRPRGFPVVCVHAVGSGRSALSLTRFSLEHKHDACRRNRPWHPTSVNRLSYVRRATPIAGAMDEAAIDEDGLGETERRRERKRVGHLELKGERERQRESEREREQRGRDGGRREG